MDIVLLDYLLRLFAVIANLYPTLLFENVKDFIKSFLLKELNPEIEAESLQLFYEYYQMYADHKNAPDHPDNLQTLIQTIQQIECDIPQKPKFQILLRLLFFEKFLLQYSIIRKNHLDFKEILNLVIQNFNISEIEYLNCRCFIGDTLYKVPQKDRLFIIDDKRNFELDINFLH